jgi:NADH-quinone oxidoreductase subunit L
VFEPESLLWGIPLLPLAGAILCALLGGTRLRHISHLPCVIGAVGSFAITLFLLILVPSDVPVLRSVQRTWFEIGPISVKASLLIDPLSTVMLLAITFIGSWIAIFSIGYMHGDKGYTRYFSLVSLFLFAMTLLVLADNFLLFFVGWEGVGLCSYLLVGYWYAKPSAAAAARKAFLVTRLGDVGLILGFFLLWSIGGHHLQFQDFFSNRDRIDQQHEWLAIACLLIFCGAVGKSAQFPLYVWLPDAMEGPTPVSALIHAATMVTAGVYLLARFAPLFVLSPTVQIIVACTGAFTALLAALIALTQHDLKRVLAYSTVSQLGFMFLALGTATTANQLALVAVTAAIFHLFTHAFFKALLFLSAGSVMHAMGNTIDMRKFGGLRNVLPITHITFLFGAAALAGLPFLSGFWSKDAILEVVLNASKSGRYGGIYSILFVVALFTAGLTAFYTFRAYFRTFWGETRIPAEAGDHAHESPSIMTVPLLVLAVGALLVGVVVGPVTHWLSDLLGRTHSLVQASGGKTAEHHIDWPLMLLSSAIAIVFAGLAMTLYNQRPGTADALARIAPTLYRSSYNRFYVDEIYDLVFVRPLKAIALVCKGIETLVFDMVRLIASLPKLLGDSLRSMQNGLVQFYAMTTAIGLIAFLTYLVFFSK